MRLTFAVHEHERDVEEVEAIVRFACEPLDRAIGKVVAVKIVEPFEKASIPTGWAISGGRKWAGRVKNCIILRLPYEGVAKYGVPRVCYHAFDWERHGSTQAFDEQVAVLHEAGEPKFKRWPIYVVHDWREALIHIAAHEIRHIAQYENGRSRSEVDCEEFALARLEAWRGVTQPEEVVS